MSTIDFTAFASLSQLAPPTEWLSPRSLWDAIQTLETGLSLQEFEAICAYANAHPVLEGVQRIKGLAANLPRSITLTPDALYIHLKTKGGIDPLGKGCFKTVYNCLKVERNGVELMADLTVHSGLGLALEEQQLAQTLSSPYVNGAAEICYQYGQKICMIQKKMDFDGRRLVRHISATPLQRLQAAYGISHGLGDLHASGHVHRDLHLGNVLIKGGEEWLGMISDMGKAVFDPRRNPHWRRRDIGRLGEAISAICHPVFQAYPRVREVRHLERMARWAGDAPVGRGPTAYAFAEAVEKAIAIIRV